ncbi:MAG: ABC transporter ATP-binding protein [Bdellovibrio sp.]|nr:ABC transporter ATP-binding protein [Bdellovibrio sp.]
MNTNSELIQNYLKQKSDLPDGLNSFGEIVGSENVLLFSLIDLDSSLMFCLRWLVLTDKRLLLLEQKNDRLMILQELERDKIKKVVEIKSLGLTTLQFLASDAGPFYFEVQFTHRQKSMMEKMRFAIEEGVQKIEASATETYQTTILKPILDARNNLADEHKDALLRLLHYLRPYKKEVIIGMTAALCGSFISLIPAYLSGKLIDDVVRPYQSHQLNGEIASRLGLAFVFGLVGAYLLREFIIWQRLKRMSIIGEKVASDLREELFKHIQTLGADFFGRKHSGSLISRIGSDTDRIWDFIAFGVVEVTVALGTLAGLVVVLLLRDFKLGLAMVIPLPFLLYAIYWQGERMKKLFIRAWRKWSVVTSHLSDVIPGIQVVKVFGQESREVKRFTQKNKEFTEETFAFHRTWTTFWPLLMLGVHSTTILMWSLATPRMLSPAESPEHLTSGVFVSFLLYATLMVWPLEIIGQVSRMLNRALSSAYRIFEILDTRNPMPMATATKTPINCLGEIEFKNVFFSYDKLRPILKNVNFHIRPGEMIGLVGTSGGGKSTITKLLARIYDPHSGMIKIDGHDLKELEQAWLRKNVGMVLQEPYLFFGSIWENIAYGLPNANELDIIAAAKTANAHDFILSLPNGYDTLVGERGHTLSGGERQRISIARAVLHDPKILILDEATSAVDTETERKIQDALDKLVLNRTTLAIAHRLSTLRKANRLFVIDNGGIVETGTHHELMSIPNGKYAELYRLQFELESAPLLN